MLDTEKLARRQSVPPEETAQDPAPQPTKEVPFSSGFLDKTPTGCAARRIYLKTLISGVAALGIVVFVVFSIYWGSVWSTPHHNLPGWIVDFDGGSIGQGVVQVLSAIDPGVNGIVWEVVSASQFPGGISQVENAVVQEETWVALTINSGASANLTAALAAADASYNSSLAITFIGAEARNENAYRVLSRVATAQLEALSQKFAIQFAAQNLTSASNMPALLANAPQIVTRPLGYTIANIRPFDVAVASAVTFVGLIYLLILSFFIVTVSAGARLVSGLEGRLTLAALIRVRLLTSFVSYFFIALFYTMLSRAFQLPFERRFGGGGFVIFWMLNWVGMLACGLALEAMITLLTVRFVPFFLIVWIISNVSVSLWPLQVLPHVYRYGYAFPFYNISRAVRTIVFRTKNDVGMNFGILIAWTVLSCITLPLAQWFVRRKAVAAAKAGKPALTPAQEEEEGEEEMGGVGA
ncbi:hypothetical protein B0H10DRAFT_2115024 [Mycena sp. CBHHK59/15]|nr:hypothetical protein B0H10DRAFT_2119056 [Mycena sp. CBHHK59/15]KAJ6563549.1 hypothetical protein B0H10DRAFT_2115024 [Mycena sp. CBHHK59/15]